MENAKKFFEEVAKTEEAKALFEAMEKPADEEEIVAAYIEIAKKLGVELTTKEVVEYLSADKAIGAELDDEELDQLVGGAKEHESCWNTYKSRQQCWALDSCDVAVVKYTGSYCNKVLKDGSWMNPSEGIVSAETVTNIAGTATDIANEFK